MALEIKQNNVKYQGRDDYSVLYYDVLDTGKKYFFLDGENGKLKNGNVIATTNLKIAINANKPEELAEIGVVNQDGQEVIPFDNRRIKRINDDILLAEPVTPVSENVAKALEDRSNPQEATRLVSAANTIKEKVNNSMGANGKFVFNDLFSEATIYDIEGNNLVNGEFYSFVGVNDNSLFLSKNDPEAEIVSLPLNANDLENASEVVAPEDVLESNLDVSEVEVNTDAVEEAFNNEATANEVVEDTVEQVEAPAQEPADLEPETLDEETAPEEVVEEVVPNEVVDDSLETNTEVEEQPMNDVVVEDNIEATPEVEDNKFELNIPSAEIEEAVPSEDANLELNLPVDNTEEVNEDLNIEPMDEEFDYHLEDSQVKVDSIDNSDSFDDFVEEKSFNETGIAEGTEIVEKMIAKMKEQDNQINSLESQLNEQKDINRNVARKAKELEERMSSLTRENSELEDKSNYYKRVAVTLADENKGLKKQLEDKEKLLGMLNEAKKLLSGDNEPRYDFDDENIFKRIS